MADAQHGHCKGCRFFNTSSQKPQDTEIASCMQPDLADFDLEVSGASGCNAFEARVGLSGLVQEEAQAPVQ